MVIESNECHFREQNMTFIAFFIDIINSNNRINADLLIELMVYFV